MKIIYRALLGAAALLNAGVALADVVGNYGTVVQVTVNARTSDAWNAAQGWLMIDEGQQFYRKYQWGGAACSGRLMSEADVANLLMALKERGSLVVTPGYKKVAAGLRCLVSYRITAAEVAQ
jgi:hypothetical protein